MGYHMYRLSAATNLKTGVDLMLVRLGQNQLEIGLIFRLPRVVGMR